MPTPVTSGKHKIRDAKAQELLNLAREFARSLPTGRGFFAARRALEKAACAYDAAELAVEMRGDHAS